MTFTTRARVMPPATLKGEFSSLPGRKRTRPRACGNRCPAQHHSSAGPLRCWQRDGSVRERDLAGFAVRGGSQRLSEGDDAAARHGQGSDKNGAARAQHAPPKGEKRGRTRLASPSFLCENNYLTLNLFRMRPCRTGLGPLPSPDDVARAATNACEIAPRVTLRARTGGRECQRVPAARPSSPRRDRGSTTCPNAGLTGAGPK